MSDIDQGFSLPVSGQADWDTDLNANFNIVARGYHVLGTAGTDINTGVAVTISSDGFFRPFNANSTSNRPHAYAYKAVSSGEQDKFLLRGMVRSLGVNTPVVPGLLVFGSPNSPGYAVSSYSGASQPLGIAVAEDTFFFAPGREIFPETLVRSASIAAIVDSSHLFTMDGGRGGFIRQVIMESSSSDLTQLFLWSNSARTGALYETFSGGVSCVGSFLDQAGLPYWNTDASTISGLVYGTLKMSSGSQVTTDTIGVQIVFERFK